MILPIQGLKVATNEATEDLYYFNDEMLSDGIFIKYNTLENDEIEIGQRGCIDSYLEVGCLSKDNGIEAEYYILYWDVYLSGIQVYRMVKDVYEIYRTSASKFEFKAVMRELSSQYRSSSMQTDIKHKHKLQTEIIEEIELIKELSAI